MRSSATHFAFRVPPGSELKSALLAFVEERGLGAVAVVTCVGSTTTATLRLAGASAEGSNKMLEVETSSEILALVGTLGAGGAHLHMTLGDADGAVVGGHLVAAEVHTTAEIVLVALDDLTFARPMDSSTGFKELAVVANANAVSAAAPAGAPARALSATAGAVEDTSLVHPARDLIGYGGAPPQPRFAGFCSRAGAPRFSRLHPRPRAVRRA